MTTKYILHGGSAQHTNTENDKFYREILKDTGNSVKILLVHFAGSPDRAKLNKTIDTAQFERNRGNKKLTFQIALQKDFYNQIDWADIIYFGGGTTVKLLDELHNFKGLKAKFQGKIVAGESAGANFLAAYCYSKSGGGIIKCLGILPIKFIPHFTGEHKEEFEKIEKNLETVALTNYQFRVFELADN